MITKVPGRVVLNLCFFRTQTPSRYPHLVVGRRPSNDDIPHERSACVLEGRKELARFVLQ